MDRPIYNADFSTVVDLGCWQGVTTKAYAEAHPHAQIIGVELMTDNYNVAKELLQPYGERITLHNAGVWSYTGQIECAVWASETSHIRATRDVQQGTPAVLQCVTLDEVTKDCNAIDFIKFDIEAAEHEVLRHGGEWVRKTRYLFIEIHDINNDAVRTLAQNLGFVVTREEHEKIWATNGSL